MLENFEKGYVKAIKKTWKLPTLKGKSKIKEGECLLNLGKTKEVSIKERHNKCQKSIKKNIELQTWLLASMIKPPMLFDDWDWLFIKEKTGFALWCMLRELWYLRLIKVYVTFSTKTTREREMMNSWCWS
jgi:hypothetical protein